jgi:hypothetical protein
MSMLKPNMGTAIAARESKRVLTIAIRFVRIGSQGTVNGALAVSAAWKDEGI